MHPSIHICVFFLYANSVYPCLSACLSAWARAVSALLATWRMPAQVGCRYRSQHGQLMICYTDIVGRASCGRRCVYRAGRAGQTHLLVCPCFITLKDKLVREPQLCQLSYLVCTKQAMCVCCLSPQ